MSESLSWLAALATAAILLAQEAALLLAQRRRPARGAAGRHADAWLRPLRPALNAVASAYRVFM